MKAYVTVAAIAACVMGSLTITAPASANLLQLFAPKSAQAPADQNTTAEPASDAKAASGTRQRKRPRAAKKPPVQEAQDAPAPQTAEADPESPLPVIPVRTTREPNDEGIPIVSADEMSALDFAVASQSLLTSTIAYYLGVPAIAGASETDSADTDGAETAPAVEAETFSADAREAYAAEPQKTPDIAVEYILITFGGALAAAAAMRIFAV